MGGNIGTEQQPTIGSALSGTITTAGFHHVETEDEKLLREYENLLHLIVATSNQMAAAKQIIEPWIEVQKAKIKQQYSCEVTTSSIHYVAVNDDGEVMEVQPSKWASAVRWIGKLKKG